MGSNPTLSSIKNYSVKSPISEIFFFKKVIDKIKIFYYNINIVNELLRLFSYKNRYKLLTHSFIMCLFLILYMDGSLTIYIPVAKWISNGLLNRVMRVRIPPGMPFIASITQLAEQSSCKRKVKSSNLFTSSILRMGGIEFSLVSYARKKVRVVLTSRVH